MSVSLHAIERFQERVAPVSADEAVATLSTPRILEMVDFGASEIILGTGHHIVVKDRCVVTVRPRIKKKRKRRPINQEGE